MVVREKERVREIVSVCVCEKEKKSERKCVCVREREREQLIFMSPSSNDGSLSYIPRCFLIILLGEDFLISCDDGNHYNLPNMLFGLICGGGGG